MEIIIYLLFLEEKYHCSIAQNIMADEDLCATRKNVVLNLITFHLQELGRQKIYIS
jgi:hypothetical protein